MFTVWVRENTGMSNALFREREVAIAGPSSLKTPQKGAYQNVGEATLESKLGIQSFNERIERWFGSTQQFSDRVVRGWKLCIVDCLAFPYTVYCRQCQVYPYYRVSPSPLAPFRSIAALHRIARTQGIHAWWRGWNSHMILQIVHPLVDTLLDRIWEPSDSKDTTQLKTIARYLTLRSVVCAVTLPLVSYTYLEMVQNTTHRVYNSILEVAFQRPFLMAGSSQQLPFLLLLGPTVLHSVAFDAICHLVRQGLSHFIPGMVAVPRSSSLRTALVALSTSFCTSFVASTVLYPLQTVLVRLYCQGMPMLVDNVQSGMDVTYVKEISRGFLDCIRMIWEGEGPLGFYKGYSSLLLQYMVQGLLLLLLWRLVHYLESKGNKQQG